MMIHLEYLGKAARVALENPTRKLPKPSLTFVTTNGVVKSASYLLGVNPSSTITKDSLLESDNEIDFNKVGEAPDRDSLTPVFINPTTLNPSKTVSFIDIIYNDQAVERERRPRLIRHPNINLISPLKLTKRIRVPDAFIQFIFKRRYQLVHLDGLTREFLYNLSKDLHDNNEASFIGGGTSGNQPLVFTEDGNPYRGLLLGKIGINENVDKYQLTLLISDQEFKSLEQPNG